MVWNPEESEAMIRKMGNYSVLCKGVGTFHNSVQSGSTQHTMNVGSSYSQLLGVNWVHTDATADHDKTLANTDFKRYGINRWGFSIDGVMIENQKMIFANEPAEIVAFSAIQKGVLAKTSGVPESLSYDAVNSDEGSASIFTMSFENYKSACGGFAQIRENHCSGRSTLSATTNLNLEYSTPVPNNASITLFAKYAQLITFDQEANLFRVSQ